LIPALPYYPEMPDLANCCKHYPTEQISRDSPENEQVVENHHIFCKVFGHNWKFTEDRWKKNADESTDSLDSFRFISIIRQCKMCGTMGWEYFPHDRFKDGLEEFLPGCD